MWSEYLIGRIHRVHYEDGIGLRVELKLGDLGRRGTYYHLVRDREIIRQLLSVGRISRHEEFVGMPVYALIIDNSVDSWRPLYEVFPDVPESA
jgi:hypothetical protein